MVVVFHVFAGSLHGLPPDPGIHWPHEESGLGSTAGVIRCLRARAVKHFEWRTRPFLDGGSLFLFGPFFEGKPNGKPPL